MLISNAIYSKNYRPIQVIYRYFHAARKVPEIHNLFITEENFCYRPPMRFYEHV